MQSINLKRCERMADPVDLKTKIATRIVRFLGGGLLLIMGMLIGYGALHWLLGDPLFDGTLKGLIRGIFLLFGCKVFLDMYLEWKITEALAEEKKKC